MANLVTTTPIPFDAVKLPYTAGYSFGGGGNFKTWTNAGPYEANGKIWCCLMKSVPQGGINAAVFLSVFSSADAGSTWTEEDSAGAPQLSTNGVAAGIECDVTFGHDDKFHVFVRPSNAGTHLSIQTFNTATGLWGTSIVGPLADSVPLGGLVNEMSVYQNTTDTNLILFFDRTNVTSNTVIWLRVTAGVFGVEHILRASAVGNAIGPNIVIDSADVAHVIFTDGGVSTYQAVNPDNSLGVAVPTGAIAGGQGKAVIWQSTIALCGFKVVAGRAQPFVTICSPASSPTTFTASQVFSEPLDPTSLSGGGGNGMRLIIDGANALWVAWVALSHVPGTNADPVTVSNIKMAELCTPISDWGNDQLFWDQLTDPQTDQPLNDPSALSFRNFSLAYVPGTDTFNGIANISGFDQTYGYFLQSDTAVADITVCSTTTPEIVCDDPPVGKIGVPYSHAFPAAGGSTPYTFSIHSGHLPPGLSLNSGTGVVSGTPSESGAFVFTVRVTDNTAAHADVECSILVKSCLLVDLRA